jgi:CBS domain-containing protein
VAFPLAIIHSVNFGIWSHAMRAHQIMTRQVITVGPETLVVEAANKMLNHHISGLPVVDVTGKLIGIISEGDFIRRAEIGTQRERGRWLRLLVGPGRIASDFVHERGRKVGEIMTSNLVTITEDTSLEEIVRTIEQRNIKRLPVVRPDHLVGIVTRSNLLQVVADFARDVPDPTPDDDHIRNSIRAAIENADWVPSRFNVIVRDGIAHLSGIVTDERCRRAAIVAAENVPGVRHVHDELRSYPRPEEDLGGGDIVSLQEQPPTTDDAPL